MTKSDRFVYRGRDRTVESVVRKSKQSGGSYDSYLSSEAPKFAPKEGECAIRILPGTWEDTDKWGTGWDIGVHVHHSVGPDNGAYLCLDKMKGETCPVCEARREATDEDEKDQLRASQRFLCWVVDRDNEKAGPMLWAMPLTLFREINARSVEKKSNTPILIDDPEEGYDIIFSRTGTGIKTKYTAVEVVRDPSPLHDDEQLQQRWLDYITEHPLPEMLNFFEADYIEKVLFGKAPSRKNKAVDDDVEDAAPMRGEPRRRPPVNADDDDGDDVPSQRSSRHSRRDEVSGDDGGASQAEAPSRGRLRGSARSEDDDEDDSLPFDVDSKDGPDADEDVEQQARGRLNKLKSRGRG
jgi:hypothetical protein